MDVLDAGNLVTYCEDALNSTACAALSKNQFIDIFKGYLFQNVVNSLPEVNNMGQTCNGVSDPVGVELSGTNIEVTLCLDLVFSRSYTAEIFKTDNLLSTLDGFVELEMSEDPPPSINVEATFSLGAKINGDLNDPGSFDFATDVSIDPVVGSLKVDGNVGFTVAFGMIDVSMNAAVAANAEVILEYCGPGTSGASCDDDDSRKLKDVPLYLGRSADFSLVGDIDVKSNFPGASDILAGLATKPQVSVVVADVFDPDPMVIIPNNVNFLTDFQIFSPSNAVNLIRFADSALVRAQESTALDVNLPVVDKAFSKVLSTGSVLTSKLLEYFVIPEPFEERQDKSLILVSSADFQVAGKSAELKYPLQLKFYMFKADTATLTTNPENFLALSKDSGVTKCDFSLTEEPTSAALFASALRTGIDACSNVKACSIMDDGCGKLDKTNDYVCTTTSGCDVVVDVEGNKIFIATVAYAGTTANAAAKDVHLIGLYDNDPKTDQPTGPGDLFKFPLNQAENPGLIPRFRNFEDLSSRINLAINNEIGFSGVNVSFQYIKGNVSASCPSDDASYKPQRFEVDIGFAANLVQFAEAKDVDLSTGVNTSVDWGDLANIQTDAKLEVSGDINFGANFGVLLEADTSEELVLPLTVCGGDELDCSVSTDNYEIVVTLTENGMELAPVTLNLRGVPPSTLTPKKILHKELKLDPTIGGFVSSIEEKEPTSIVVKFISSITAYNVTVPKNCKKAPAKAEDPFLNTSPVTACPEGNEAFIISNDFGLVDTVISKRPFQFAIGPVTLNGNLQVDGDASVTAAVGGVLEVNADVTAGISGSISVTAGDCFLPAVDWLIGLTKVFANSTVEGHRPDFLTASAMFGGNFDATARASPPFDSVLEVDAMGSFTGFDIDFTNVSAKTDRPKFDFTVDFPELGDLKEISFKNVLDMLDKVLEFLVGEGSVEECSDGLLGKDVFTYKLPVVGFSVCESMRFLQVFVDAIAELTGVEDSEAEGSTFSALETKLNALLKDSVGGTPMVNLASVVSGVYTDLTVDIVLRWGFEEMKELQLDMAVLLDGLDDPGVENFQKAFSPPAGQAGIDVTGELIVTFALGVEYNSDKNTATPYLGGQSGLEVTFQAAADIEFEAAIGPLTGSVAGSFMAGTSASPLKLVVGLKESDKNYYLLDPPSGTTRADFIQTTNLLDNITATFSGAASLDIDVSVPLIQATADIEVSISDINNVFTNVDNAISIDKMEFQILKPEVPSFLDILLSDPQAIVNALDLVLETAEDASLGVGGIVTTFDIPFTDAVQNAMGAGTRNNVIGNARKNIIPKLQETLNAHEGDSDTVAELMGAVVTDLLQDINLMDESNEVIVQCFQYNEANETHKDVACNGDAGSVQWTVPLGANYSIEIPLDFSVAQDGLPLEISMSGTPGVDAVPTISIGWGFNLSFGFDENDGFFLNTEGDGTPEFTVSALLDVPSRQIDATLFFLAADLRGVCLQVGAALFVDIDKESALRKPDEMGRKKGRLTIPELKSITKISELFQIGATAAAALEIDEESSIAIEVGGALETVEKWIPKLQFGGSAQFRTEVTKDTRRRLLSSKLQP